MTFDVRTLHEIERKIIKALVNGKLTLDVLTQQTGLNVDQVRRGIEWLRSKNIINYKETVRRFIILKNEGQKAAEVGRPEVRLAASTPTSATYISDAQKKADLTAEELSTAIPIARSKGWITFDTTDKSKIMKLSDPPLQSPEDQLLQKITKTPMGKIATDSLNEEEIQVYQELRAKHAIYFELPEKEEKIPVIELSPHGLIILKDVETVSERAIDVTAPAPVIYAGRKHPLQDVVDEVREVFVGLGFQEVEGPMVQNSFWNFDALFTPQDHPAREMQDTFYIASLQAGNVADKKTVNNVSGIHKKGWGYKWNINDARKLVLRTHTTPVTIRYLADNKPDEDRVFSVGRVFRNEKLTYKHLAEFYQVEGIVVGRNVTLRDLMGLQTEFYSKMGLKKVKFWPSFFPYTEPSLQSMVYHERLGKWVELFGMGIFRPEVTIPIGVKNPVLAWGGGLERIAMLRYELDDVRELYNNKLSWLRSVPKCQL